jgi:ParB family transcriptional regulator, chromosome partitioning protein
MSSGLDKIIAAAKQRGANIPSVHTGGTYPLERIRPRENDTRLINALHVAELAESIAVLGLIEPLALDCNGRLLAGGHRLAAIQQLQIEKPTTFEQQFPNGNIPARIFSFDADHEPDLALQIEIAENEKRRDYTPAEVKAIAERLRVSGYADLKGRPKKGQKALMPALSVVIGKSIRTVQNYLSEADPTEKPPTDESTKYFALLKTAHRALSQCQGKAPNNKGAKEFSKLLPTILEQIEQVLDNVPKID